MCVSRKATKHSLITFTVLKQPEICFIALLIKDRIFLIFLKGEMCEVNTLTLMNMKG